MAKTIAALLMLIFAILYLPFWVQIALFVLAVAFIPFKIALVIPALFADAWYAPERSLSLSDNRMLLIVLGLLLVYQLLIKTTRIGLFYGVEKK